LISRFNNSTFILVITLFFIVNFAVSPYSRLVYAEPNPTKPKLPVAVLNSKTGKFTIGTDPLFNGCVNRVVILVHGWNQFPESVLDDFNRASMALDANGVDGRVVGFNWTSETLKPHKLPYDPTEIATALGTAAFNADNAGHALAKYIMDSRSKCSGNVWIYIVAHSIGTRVVKSALEQLASNVNWNSNHYKLQKIFFLGAALDRITPDIKSPFGIFIKTSVLHFYNLYSGPDKSLPLCKKIKLDCDLGAKGASPSIATPPTYADKNAADLIIANNDANGDLKCDIRNLYTPHGDCFTVSVGENHLGYWGFWDTSKHLINSGPMSLVSSLMLTDKDF
jgi:alpha/beta hydrolase family protein DUF900